MALFESVLTLLLLAIVFLQVSRRLRIPYPTMLAAAGLGVAALPWAPAIALDPKLVLVLFIAPAILDSAFEFPLRTIRRYWIALFALAVVAVLITTAAVAWFAIAIGGLPIAAAIVLGAIVSPPDAAAAAAMLSRPAMPRSTATVLKGESLLNDAVALFIFSIGMRLNYATGDVVHLLPQLAFAIPGGIVLGIVCGRLATLLIPFLAGTLGGVLFQFVATYGAWLIADYLGFSAIITVVAMSMTAARYGGGMAARDRLHSNSVWAVIVFLLNVLAFLFIGLEARTIILGLDAAEFRDAMRFALGVLAVVIVVRVVVVMIYNRAIQPVYGRLGYGAGPTIKQGIVASWCGMRGMVTLAAALALPDDFPKRDLIVLAALTVVIGTLVVQGLTLEPLVRLLKFPPDRSRDDEIERTRATLAEIAVSSWPAGLKKGSPEAKAARLSIIAQQRDQLRQMRFEGRIEEETFRRIEQEIDLDEVAALHDGRFDLVDT